MAGCCHAPELGPGDSPLGMGKNSPEEMDTSLLVNKEEKINVIVRERRARVSQQFLALSSVASEGVVPYPLNPTPCKQCT